jgi:hypothetical protein
MSVQNQAPNGPKLKAKRPAPNKIQEVTVRAKLEEPGISPQTITLTNAAHMVRWRCVGLVRGSRLEIDFPGDRRGPFQALIPHPARPHEVTGYGNRGPQRTEEEYDYEVRIVRKTGLAHVVGSGRLINKVTQVFNDPLPGGLGDPPLGDPIG